MRGDIGNPIPTRREAVVAIGAAATVALTGTARGETVAADRPIQSSLVSGVVFEDRSGTGRRQPDDPGVASQVRHPLTHRCNAPPGLRHSGSAPTTVSIPREADAEPGVIHPGTARGS